MKNEKLGGVFIMAFCFSLPASDYWLFLLPSAFLFRSSVIGYGSSVIGHWLWVIGPRSLVFPF